MGTSQLSGPPVHALAQDVPDPQRDDAAAGYPEDGWTRLTRMPLPTDIASPFVDPSRGVQVGRRPPPRAPGKGRLLVELSGIRTGVH